MACKFVEAFQKCERHRRGQKRAQHFIVEIEMHRLRHVAQICLDAFWVNSSLPTFRKSLERGVVQRALFGVEKIAASERFRNKKRCDFAVCLRRAGEFNANAPSLALFAVWPGEFQRHISDGTAPHVLRNAIFLLLGVTKTITF